MQYGQHDEVELRLREAGAGGSNPLTPTSNTLFFMAFIRRSRPGSLQYKNGLRIGLHIRPQPHIQPPSF